MQATISGEEANNFCVLIPDACSHRVDQFPPGSALTGSFRTENDGQCQVGSLCWRMGLYGSEMLGVFVSAKVGANPCVQLQARHTQTQCGS